MTQQDQDHGKSDASPGGIRDGGAASPDMDEIGMKSIGNSPTGESGGGAPTGPAANGSFGSGTYNERGDTTGPDSPAGSDAMLTSDGQAQGDDLADRLGGKEGRGTGTTGAGAATGDMSADRSERADRSAAGAAGADGPDAGSPGGMGGAHVREGAGTGSDRPPGGVSPMGNDGGRD